MPAPVCPSCSALVLVDAKYCAVCGAHLAAEPAESSEQHPGIRGAPATSTSSSTTGGWSRRKTWAVVAIVIGGLAAGILLGALKDQPPPAAKTATEADAIRVCHGQLDGQLNAPLTARFDLAGAPTVVRNGDNFQITGTVDAENSLGVALRRRYSCSLTFAGGDQWNLGHALVLG